MKNEGKTLMTMRKESAESLTQEQLIAKLEEENSQLRRGLIHSMRISCELLTDDRLKRLLKSLHTLEQAYGFASKGWWLKSRPGLGTFEKQRLG